MNFEEFLEEGVQRSEWTANRQLSHSHAQHDHEHQRREQANSTSRMAMQKHRANQAKKKKSPFHKLKKMFSFEEFMEQNDDI